MISPTFTFPEEDVQALRHVDPKEPIEITDKSTDSGQGHRLGYAMLCKVFAPE